MLIEPSTDDTAAQRRIEQILQGDLHDLPSPKILSGHFVNDSAKTDRLLGTARGEGGKPGSVLIAPRIMLQQLPQSRNPQALD